MADTVGALLAAIATRLQDGLRILMFADKRGWGPDEFAQVRALEEALDEAKRDFQAMAPLVNGQFYYENDRRPESLQELRLLQTKFDHHAQTFHDWIRMGGPINPLWLRETTSLRRQLHRAQCRAARRIFNAEREDGGSGGRCLGAYLLFRKLRPPRSEPAHHHHHHQDQNLPTWKAQQPQLYAREQQQAAGRESLSRRRADTGDGDAMEMTGLPADRPRRPTLQLETLPATTPTRRSLEDIVPDCAAIGSFLRFGDHDIAFVCDYCDGHMIWENIQSLPTTRRPRVGPSSSRLSTAAAAPPPPPDAAAAQLPATYRLPIATPRLPTPPPPRQPSPSGPDDYPRWQATATAASDKDVERTIVFAPLAIANHLPPAIGDWEARLWCPYCDDYLYYDSAEGDSTRYAQDEAGFPSLAAFQEHLEWDHTALPVPAATDKCSVM